MSGSVSPSLIIYPSGLNFFPILKPQINEKGTTLYNWSFSAENCGEASM